MFDPNFNGSLISHSLHVVFGEFTLAWMHTTYWHLLRIWRVLNLYGHYTVNLVQCVGGGGGVRGGVDMKYKIILKQRKFFKTEGKNSSKKRK